MALAAARAIIRRAADARQVAAAQAHRSSIGSTHGIAHASSAAQCIGPHHSSLFDPLGGLCTSRLFATSSGSSGTSVARRLQAQLVNCLSAQDAPRAETLLRSFEAQGGRCDTAMLNAWIGCFRSSSDWRGAERVWQRISELKLRPDSVSYRNLIKVYTTRGSTAQLAKIGPLLAEMHEAGLSFSALDFQQLIKTAHACDKPNVVRSWVELARAAGISEKLDEPTRRIAANPINRAPAVARTTPQRTAAAIAADLATVQTELTACLETGDAARANELLLAFEQRGGRATVSLFNIVLGCHKHAADWAGAERVWARMTERQMAPSNVSCRTLVQIYTLSGIEQRSKIKLVLAAMKEDGVRFNQHDYEQLIKTAHACDLPREVLRWAKRARADGMLAQLDHAARRIAEIAAANLRPLSSIDLDAAQQATAASPAISTGIPAVASSRSPTLPSPAPRVSVPPSVNRAALMALLHGDAFAAPTPTVDDPTVAEASAGVAPVAAEASSPVAATAEAALPAAVSSASTPSVAAPVAASPTDVAAAPQTSPALPADLAAYFADSDRSTILSLDRAIYRNSIIEQMQSDIEGDSGDAERTAQIDSLILEMQAAHLTFTLQDYGILIKNAHVCKLPAEVRRWSDRAREAGVFEQLDTLAKRVAARALAEADVPLDVSAPVDDAIDAAVAAALAPSPPPPSVAAAPRLAPPIAATRRPASTITATPRPASATAVSTDPSVLRRQLQNCVLSGSAARAEQIVREVHKRGGACSVAMIQWWIGSCLKHGDWECAERAWAFMLELNLQPTHASYCKLIQVYLHTRSNEHLAKTGSLLIAMHHATIAFSVRDYEQLIKCAHACKLPVQVRRWTEVARSAGVFDELDELSRALATWPCNRDANAPPAVTPVAAASPSRKRLIQTAHKAALDTEVRKLSDRARAAGLFHKPDQTTRTIAATVAPEPDSSAQPIGKAAAISALLHGKDSEAPRTSAASIVAAEPAPTQTASSSSQLAATAAAAAADLEAVASFVVSEVTPASASAAVSESKSASRPAEPAVVNSDSPVRTVSALSAWLKCYANAGDWKGAERVWQQAAAVPLKLTSSVPYRNLILVYLQAGGHHLAKIDALLPQMHDAAQLSFNAKDFEKLILASLRCERPQELRRWTGAARAAGLFEKIPKHIRDNAEKALAATPMVVRSSLAPPVQRGSSEPLAATKVSQAATAPTTNASQPKQPQPQQSPQLSTTSEPAATPAPRPQQAPRAPRAPKSIDSPSQMELELARAIVRSLAALEQHPFRMDHAQQGSTAMMQ